MKARRRAAESTPRASLVTDAIIAAESEAGVPSSPEWAARTGRCWPSSWFPRATTWPASFGVTPSVYASNLAPVLDKIELVKADLLESDSLVEALAQVRPRKSTTWRRRRLSLCPGTSRCAPRRFAAVGVTSLLEAIRAVGTDIRFYQASSSEIFGAPRDTPQTEDTPLSPVTPYGVAKAYGHFIARRYRSRYGLFACCGILYNHESPRRPLDFLPRKVARAAAAISLGLESPSC